jgi:hypothetical protein
LVVPLTGRKIIAGFSDLALESNPALHSMPVSSPSFRREVLAACSSQLESRIMDLQHQLKELTDGAGSDAKSSAGDKHETARAMMQLEQERIGQLLDRMKQEKGELERLADGSGPAVSNGSIVRTNRGVIFLGVALGKITAGSTGVMTITVRSPLGSGLLGLQAGDVTTVNGMAYTIEEVF